MITLDDELRYNLPRLPDPPFPGLEESRRLNAVYEAERRAYRVLHPHAPKVDLG